MGFEKWKLIQSQPPPPKRERASITLSELNAVLRSAIGSQGHIYLGDFRRWLPSLEDVEILLDADETNHFQYVADSGDNPAMYNCNHFAAHLYGEFNVPGWAQFAFGLQWTDKHALCILVDQNRDVWWVEPQNDKRRSQLLDWQGEINRFVLM